MVPLGIKGPACWTWFFFQVTLVSHINALLPLHQRTNSLSIWCCLHSQQVYLLITYSNKTIDGNIPLWIQSPGVQLRQLTNYNITVLVYDAIVVLAKIKAKMNLNIRRKYAFKNHHSYSIWSTEAWAIITHKFTYLLIFRYFSWLTPTGNGERVWILLEFYDVLCLLEHREQCIEGSRPEPML